GGGWARLAVGRVRRLVDDRSDPDIRGFDERLACRAVRPIRGGARCRLTVRGLVERDGCTDRACHPVSAAGPHSHPAPGRPVRDTRDMTEVIERAPMAP